MMNPFDIFDLEPNEIDERVNAKDVCMAAVSVALSDPKKNLDPMIAFLKELESRLARKDSV